MRTGNMLNEMAARTGTRTWMWMMLSLSLLTNGFLAIKIATSTVEQQTILTPPEIRRTLKVSNLAFSKEYLEEIASFNAWLLLNVTPQNADFKINQLLRYVAPEYKDALEKELRKNALWLKRNNVSSYFTPVSVAADENDNTVVIKGKFEVKRNNIIADSKDRQFIASYRNQNGTIELLSIKELIPENAQQKPNAELNRIEEKELKTETVIEQNDVRDYQGGGRDL